MFLVTPKYARSVQLGHTRVALFRVLVAFPKRIGLQEMTQHLVAQVALPYQRRRRAVCGRAPEFGDAPAAVPALKAKRQSCRHMGQRSQMPSDTRGTSTPVQWQKGDPPKRASDSHHEREQKYGEVVSLLTLTRAIDNAVMCDGRNAVIGTSGHFDPVAGHHGLCVRCPFENAAIRFNMVFILGGPAFDRPVMPDFNDCV